MITAESKSTNYAKVILSEKDIEVEDFEIENDDPRETFGYVTSPGTAVSSSRARMLAQQRELALKKRQAAIQSTGY